MLSSKLSRNKKALSLSDSGVYGTPPSPVYIKPFLSSFPVRQRVAFRVVTCCLLIICVSLTLSSSVLADDGKKSDWYWCTNSWPVNTGDGFTAADHRFEYMNPWSEWPVRIPIETRTTAGDERYIIYPYVPPKVDYGQPITSGDRKDTFYAYLINLCSESPTPILIKIRIPTTKPNEIRYDAPPSLDKAQMIRWGQALPSSRVYLARLWDIPKEVAEQYGAKY